MTKPNPNGVGARNVIVGMLFVAGCLWIGYLGVDSMRTGIPVHTRDGPDLEGWAVLAMAVFGAFLGLCVVGVGLGLVKLRSPQPPALRHARKRDDAGR